MKNGRSFKVENIHRNRDSMIKFNRRVIYTLLILLVIIFIWEISFWVSGSRIDHGNVSFDISPTGDQLVIAAADGNLYLFDLKTLKVMPFVTSPIEKSDPKFSPDGTMIVYSEGTADKEGKHLVFRSINEKQIIQLTHDSKFHDRNPAYSPDGTRVVFSRAALGRPYSMGGWTWDHWDIWIVNIDGTHLQRITHQNYRLQLHPLFMPKKKQIVYDADLDDVISLYIVSEQPGAIPKLFGEQPKSGQNTSDLAKEPTLSKDGNLLAFISDRSIHFERDIWLMSTEGKNAQALGITSVSDQNRNPTFFPDGKRLLFLAGRESGAGARPVYSLWQVSLSDKKSHEVADSGLFTAPMHWKPKN